MRVFLLSLLRYILFHHQTTTANPIPFHRQSCVISSFITKPQPAIRRYGEKNCCVISSFITKPQRYFPSPYRSDGCVISSFITKPQRLAWDKKSHPVALYPLSSPNHNYSLINESSIGLRYILFHHQTTTWRFLGKDKMLLRYILFHHQTTTSVVTSCTRHELRYILFHHQTTTMRPSSFAASSCVISSFITKPQPTAIVPALSSVALYPLSSPNHNHQSNRVHKIPLRYILFHHQTTTVPMQSRMLLRLRYILFHHQTTTLSMKSASMACCVISSFITKPQLV